MSSTQAEFEYVETKRQTLVKIICQVAGGFIGAVANKTRDSDKALGTLVFVKHEEIRWRLTPIEEGVA